MADPIGVITAPELVSYPGAGAPSLENAVVYVGLVNGLITEAWAAPEDPIPYWVRTIALETGARAARNPKGLSSWTRSVDDGSRTERLPDTAARAGVWLTDTDRARLGGRSRRRRRFGTIRTTPGYLPNTP